MPDHDDTPSRDDRQTPERYADDPDTALALRCMQHDRVAWGRFVQRFSRLIYSVVYDTLRRHGVPPEEDRVEELFHTAFFALYDNDYRRLRQWSRRCSLASWVRLVAASTVIDRLRKMRHTVTIDHHGSGERDDTDALEGLVLVDDRESVLRLLQRADQVRAVRAALAQLPDGDRQLLVRLFVDEAPAPELAAEFGIRPGALYTRKNRALGRLKAILDDAIDDL